jgi:DNA-binding XRE family transcriptional regulator
MTLRVQTTTLNSRSQIEGGSAVENRLRELRTAAGLAQQGLAVRAGVSPTLIVTVEKWGYRPTERVREKIASALECAPADIWPQRSETVSAAAAH